MAHPLEDGARAVIDEISRMVDGLDAGSLTGDEVGALDGVAGRLAEIVAARREALDRISALFNDWRTSHSEVLAETPDLAHRAEILSARIDGENISETDLRNILSRLTETVEAVEQLKARYAPIDNLLGATAQEAESSGTEANAQATASPSVDDGGLSIGRVIGGSRPEAPILTPGDPQAERELSAPKPAEAPESDEAEVNTEADADQGSSDEGSAAKRAPGDSEPETPGAPRAEPETSAPKPTDALESDEADTNTGVDTDLSASDGGLGAGRKMASSEPRTTALTPSASHDGEMGASKPAGAPSDTTDKAIAQADDAGTAGRTRGQDTPGAPKTDVVPSADLSGARIDAVIGEAIGRHRFGVAYHLSHAASGSMFNPDLITLVASNYATDEREFATTDLPNVAETVKGDAEKLIRGQALDPDLAALIVGATLVPCHLAPGGPVGQLLSALAPLLSNKPSLQDLALAVADVSRTGMDIPLELLGAEDPAELRQQELSRLRQEVRQWLDRENRTKIKYQAGTRVWKRMLDDWSDGEQRASIGKMMSMLLEPVHRADANRVARFADHWKDKGNDEIKRINRDLGRKSNIIGGARMDILEKINQSVALAGRWRRLAAQRFDKQPNFDAQLANRLRETVRRNAEAAQMEIGEIDIHLARCAGDMVQRYISLFDGAASGRPAPTLTLSDLLNGDLLANPDIPFDEHGKPLGVPLEIGLVAPLARNEEPSFDAAAIKRATRRDFGVAAATIDFARRSGYTDDADQAAAKVEKLQATAQVELESRIAQVGAGLDAAYARGLMSWERWQELEDRLSPRKVEVVGNFRTKFESLSGIEREIRQVTDERRDSLKRSFQNLPNVSPGYRALVDQALEDGQYQVAEDYMERIRNGEELPKTSIDDNLVFDHFFLDALNRYSAFSRSNRDMSMSKRLQTTIEAVTDGKRTDAIDASELVEPDSRDDGVRVLKAWSALAPRGPSKSNGGPLFKRLRALMSAIGFENPGVEREAHDAIVAEGVEERMLVCTPIADRRVARLPDFGSRARGRYRLIVIRSRISPETIIRHVGKRTGDLVPPNIVVFLGVLDVAARQRLARTFGGGEYRPSLVLDEALVAFLASQPGDRLRIFFDCAIPFTFSEPYDPDATAVPPEMFFGRSSERRKILAMDGDVTHFVYGGRRLGKTVLLADIVREYRSRGPDMLVLLVNLTGTGIGENKLPDELWREFVDQLAQNNVLTRKLVRQESISDAVVKWIDEKSNRRILFLVDEADKFFDADRKVDHRVLGQIKRLMERTERRFKVVFAGLHNVQRAARDPNSPFAHLGDAVRIGPMLPETDGAVIEKLVRDPLEALGYRFQSVDSIIRIAAETNYYPALVQQFCRELLRYLRENTDALGTDGPPWTILPDMVDRVFDARATRDRIRNMFSWTIQLDGRYEFLTYLIARQSFDSEAAQLRGVSVTEIRDSALEEWPGGFETDTSYWMFEVLLEEMQGLGILREVELAEQGREARGYAIRTRNLRILIGNDDLVEARFREAKRKMPPAQFDAAQFRGDLDENTPSSLTADQCRRLLTRENGVGVVFGAHLTGVDLVRESLVKAIEDRDFRLRESSSEKMSAELDQVARSRRSGDDVVFVDMRNSWDPDRIGEAVDFVGRQKAEKRMVRPVFLCGPAQAWEWLHGEKRPVRSAGAALIDVWLGPCSRDFARRWLEKREAPARESLEKIDCTVDLPWPIVAATAAKDKELMSMDEVVEAVAVDHRKFSDLMPNPITTAAFAEMCAYGAPLTADEISILSGGQGEDTHITPDDAQLFLEWADRLGLTYRGELEGEGARGHGYRLDAACAAGLAAVLAGR